MQPPLAHTVPSAGALYPEERNLIASLQRLVDQGKQVAGEAAAGVDARAQLARVFAAFG